MSRTAKLKSLNRDDFEPLARQELPQLILGIKIPAQAFHDDGYYFTDYDFISGREWKKFIHQHYFVATILKPRSKMIHNYVSALCDSYVTSDLDSGDASLDDVLKYQSKLKALFSANCNNSYKDLRKGYYPIDIKFLSHFTDEKFPNNLDDLITWRDGFHRAAGCINRFSLAIIGPQSN